VKPSEGSRAMEVKQMKVAMHSIDSEAFVLSLELVEGAEMALVYHTITVARINQIYKQNTSIPPLF
jgi:hypothetical protein